MIDVIDQEGVGEQAVDAGGIEETGRASQGEGVAGQAGDENAAIEQDTQALGGGGEQCIAVLVAEHVVGGGELVDIEQRNDFRSCARLVQAAVEFDNQRIAVGQANLAVDQGIAAQFG